MEAEYSTDDDYHGWAEHLDDQQKSAYHMDDDN
jgi:hypothetical protein